MKTAWTSFVNWITSLFRNKPRQPSEPNPDFLPDTDRVEPVVRHVPPLIGHRASFLFDDAKTRVMNILSPRCDLATFKTIVERCIRNGDDYVYLYFRNYGDGPWGPFSFYQSHRIGGDMHTAVLESMRTRLNILRDRNLGIVAWLRSDDSRMFNSISMDAELKYQVDVVRHFDEYVSAYVLGLELDEYMKGSTVAGLAAHLNTITQKHIGTHQTSGKYEYARLANVDGCWFQYGFGRTPAQIRAMTNATLGVLSGKPVFATEYHKSSDSAQARALGDAALSAGASGTGNGRSLQ